MSSSIAEAISARGGANLECAISATSSAIDGVSEGNISLLSFVIGSIATNYDWTEIRLRKGLF